VIGRSGDLVIGNYPRNQGSDFRFLHNIVLDLINMEAVLITRSRDHPIACTTTSLNRAVL
jgi:hypothetical protein